MAKVVYETKKSRSFRGFNLCCEEQPLWVVQAGWAGGSLEGACVGGGGGTGPAMPRVQTEAVTRVGEEESIRLSQGRKGQSRSWGRRHECREERGRRREVSGFGARVSPRPQSVSLGDLPAPACGSYQTWMLPHLSAGKEMGEIRFHLTGFCGVVSLFGCTVNNAGMLFYRNFSFHCLGLWFKQCKNMISKMESRVLVFFKKKKKKTLFLVKRNVNFKG